MKTVYLQTKQDGLPFDSNVFRAFEGFSHLGYKPIFYTEADRILKKINPDASTPVVGTVDSVRGALMGLGVTPPLPLNYPESLSVLLGREIKLYTLAELRDLWVEGVIKLPLFVKPAVRPKLFTGKVVCDTGDIAEWGYCFGYDTKILVSEVVNFETEYRVFVMDGQILHVSHYQGDPYQSVNRFAVENAIRLYQASGSAPVAYAVDFGVTLLSGDMENVVSSNRLVEVNDAWALGCYTLDSSEYAQMLLARWKEMCEEGNQ